MANGLCVLHDDPVASSETASETWTTMAPMEIVELSVIQSGPGLDDLIYRLAERMGENVTGMSADVDDLAIHGLTVDDVVQIEGDRPRVIERLDDCDPDWRDYLSE